MTRPGPRALIIFALTALSFALVLPGAGQGALFVPLLIGALLVLLLVTAIRTAIIRGWRTDNDDDRWQG